MRAPEGPAPRPLSCPARWSSLRPASAEPQPDSKCPDFLGLSVAHSLDFCQLTPSVHLKLNGNQTQNFRSPLEIGTMSGGGLA